MWKVGTASRSHGVWRALSPSARTLWFADQKIWIGLVDGRTVGVPLAWFSRLLHATPEQRGACRISASGSGLHWESLDEDISVPGLLEGRGDTTRRPPTAA